uniref:Uncharacterized protein n=1 Tax=Hyaloperonospora arabidopsidis (strain Emoy2) TaxID=559515 RepID=M4B9Y4_HYAAE
MEGGDSSVVVSAPPKARREGSIYEKYLNIKNNVLTDEEDGAVKTCTEISNSTENSGIGVSGFSDRGMSAVAHTDEDEAGS